MRKHVSFAIAATMLGLAVGFWTITGVVETTASFGKFEPDEWATHGHSSGSFCSTMAIWVATLSALLSIAIGPTQPRKPQKCDGYHIYWPQADLASNRAGNASSRKRIGHSSGSLTRPRRSKPGDFFDRKPKFLNRSIPHARGYCRSYD